MRKFIFNERLLYATIALLLILMWGVMSIMSNDATIVFNFKALSNYYQSVNVKDTVKSENYQFLFIMLQFTLNSVFVLALRFYSSVRSMRLIHEVKKRSGISAENHWINYYKMIHTFIMLASLYLFFIFSTEAYLVMIMFIVVAFMLMLGERNITVKLKRALNNEESEAEALNLPNYNHLNKRTFLIVLTLFIIPLGILMTKTIVHRNLVSYPKELVFTEQTMSDTYPCVLYNTPGAFSKETGITCYKDELLKQYKLTQVTLIVDQSTHELIQEQNYKLAIDYNDETVYVEMPVATVTNNQFSYKIQFKNHLEASKIGRYQNMNLLFIDENDYEIDHYPDMEFKLIFKR